MNILLKTLVNTPASKPDAVSPTCGSPPGFPPMRAMATRGRYSAFWGKDRRPSPWQCVDFIESAPRGPRSRVSAKSGGARGTHIATVK